MEENIELFRYLIDNNLIKEYPVITRYDIDCNVPYMDIIIIRVYVSGYIHYGVITEVLSLYKKLIDCRYYIHLDNILYE